MFLRDEVMTGEKVLTEGRYGVVSRVFVVAEEDKTWPAEEQQRMAASCGPRVEVRAIGGADHTMSESLIAYADRGLLEMKSIFVCKFVSLMWCHWRRDFTRLQ